MARRYLTPRFSLNQKETYVIISILLKTLVTIVLQELYHYNHYLTFWKCIREKKLCQKSISGTGLSITDQPKTFGTVSCFFSTLIFQYYLTSCNSLISRGHFPHLSII